MEKRINLGLVLLLILISFCGTIYFRNIDFDFEWHNHGIRIAKYTGTDNTITLPKKFFGIPVVDCKEDVFQNIDYPHTVIIPDDMVYYASFKNDSMLEKVIYEKSDFIKIMDIPDSLLHECLLRLDRNDANDKVQHEILHAINPSVVDEEEAGIETE